MQIFENTEVAFKLRTNKELLKALLLFRFMSNTSLVKITGYLANLAIRFKIPVGWAVKPTIFSHFCGGETIDESAKVIKNLAQHKVLSVLDYAAEDQKSTDQINAVISEIIRTMNLAAENKNVPFTVFKPTALAPVSVLNSAYSRSYRGNEAPPEIELFRNNIRTLCKAAWERGIPVMVDAEESHYQDIVDKVVTEMMELYNTDKAIVYNTIQMYRHDRLDFLKTSIEAARKQKYHLGIKLVRGAYMEQERDRARKMGYPSPILPDKESTDKAYDDALRICLENIDFTSLFAGTHNEDSLMLLMDLIKFHKLNKNDDRVYSSQLYGMSDHISFNMAAQSYNVAKYLPYGPVKYLIPYLVRRAEENRSITGQSGRELHYIKLEIRRRKNSKPF
jgi:proline dehydrogenase